MPEINDRFVLGKPKGSGSASYEQWLGKPPEFEKIDVELAADVIVCGGGIAGVSAARAAIEEGAEVILFEKTEKLQCRFGDFGAIGSKVMDRWGRSGLEYKEEIISTFMKESTYWPKHQIIRYWIDNCGEALDWYLEGKPDLHILQHTTDPIPEGVDAWLQPARYPGPEGYEPGKEYYPSYQVTVQFKPSHEPVLLGNYKLAMESGLLKSYFSTPVKKLLTDDSGRVTGVIAESYDGTVYKATAKNGVVLCTGDYSGNHDMLYYYSPWLRKNINIYPGIDPEGYLADTGDGHRMGMWAGAQMERGPHAPNVHNMGGPLGVAPFLQLNVNGERFMNEDCSGQQIENQICSLPDSMAWQIFDSNWPEQLTHMPPSHGSACILLDDDDIKNRRVNHTLESNDGYASRGAINAAVEEGRVIKADTIAELIGLMGMPMETALKSIERYNQLAHNGHDEDFGKTAGRMLPVERGPFYAAKLFPAPLLLSMSGLESDREARCLNAEARPIPGLYVAGNTQGGRFAIEYPITVPGMSHSIALTYGRRAGMSAARKV